MSSMRSISFIRTDSFSSPITTRFPARTMEGSMWCAFRRMRNVEQVTAITIIQVIDYH